MISVHRDGEGYVSLNWFLNELENGDAYIRFEGEKYYVSRPEGWINEDGQRIFHVVIYQETKNQIELENSIEIFYFESENYADCFTALRDKPIWDGRSLLEIEKDVRWTD